MAGGGEEMLEVVDESGRFVRAATRAECHSVPSLIHRSVCVLVYDRAGLLFIQKRSRSKEQYPGMRDLSATGHARVGEPDEEAAGRELREELGIEAPLEPLGVFLVRMPAETELAAVYRCEHAGPLHPDPEELDGGEFLPPAEAARLPDLTPFAARILARLSIRHFGYHEDPFDGFCSH